MSNTIRADCGCRITFEQYCECSYIKNLTEKGKKSSWTRSLGKGYTEWTCPPCNKARDERLNAIYAKKKAARMAMGA